MRGRNVRSALKWVLMVVVGLTFLAGVAALLVGLGLQDPSLIAFAATSVPSSLGAGAAVFAVQTWADARASAIDEKARVSVEQLVSKSVSMISDGFDLVGVELPMRVNIATWGSPALMRKMSERTHLIDQIGYEFDGEVARKRREAGDPSMPVSIDIGHRKAQLAVLTAELITIARSDLGLLATSPKEIYEALWGTVDGYSYNEAIETTAAARHVSRSTIAKELS